MGLQATGRMSSIDCGAEKAVQQGPCRIGGGGGHPWLIPCLPETVPALSIPRAGKLLPGRKSAYNSVNDWGDNIVTTAARDFVP